MQSKRVSNLSEKNNSSYNSKFQDKGLKIPDTIRNNSSTITNSQFENIQAKLSANQKGNTLENKITNPNFIKNFIKTPPMKNNTQGPVHNSSSVNTLPNKTMIQKIKSARITSIINISNMNLEFLPPEIFDENLKFDDINWWEMVEIKKIDATNNKLTSESFEKNYEIMNFSLIPALNYLKFSFNLFKNVPFTIFSLFNLKYLDFSNNKISIVDSEIKNLKSLVEINFSNNLINFLPNEIGYLKELEIMNLSFNKLEQIPSTIGNITKLKKLDLSENCLKYLPDELNSLSLLEELLLFKNRLSHNDCFTWEGLSNLKYLDLHNNFLELMTNLPKSEKLDTLILGYNRLQNIEKLENCPNLTVLDLNNNKIENFPEEILNLQNLKTLNLMNNSINDLPPQVSLLQNLVRINIEGNPLKKINSKIRSANAEHLKAYLKTRLPEDLGGSNKINFEIKSNLQQSQNILNYHHNNRLQMNNLNLTVLPIDEIKQSVNLQLLVTLDFSNNVIKNLDEIKNLKSLKNNNISKKSSNLYEYENPNPLKYLNDQFDNFLPELREIKFSNNKIEIFPEFFVNFYNVKIIELKNNMISNFFDEICSKLEDSAVILPSLEYLDLSINKFLILPKILKFFKNLNVIIISNNSIKEISNLCQVEYCNLNTLDLGDNKIENLNYKLYRNFPNLKTFNIENNEIKTIPTDLCLLPHLSKLNLQGNPIKMLRSNIINGGTKTIIEHFRKMHKFDGEDFSFDKKNNYQFENKNTKNLDIASCQEKKIDAQEDIKTGMQNHVSDIDQVNAEILDVESELKNNTNMPMYKKTDLRKKLNNLIRLRANLMKY